MRYVTRESNYFKKQLKYVSLRDYRHVSVSDPLIQTGGRFYVHITNTDAPCFYSLVHLSDRQTDRRRDESTGRKTDGLKGRQTDRQRGDRQVWTGEQMEERATHRQAGRPTDGERDESVTFSNIQFKDQRHQNRFFFLFWTHTHTLTHTLSNSVVSSLSV